jgi:hypothetical protein
MFHIKKVPAADIEWRAIDGGTSAEAAGFMLLLEDHDLVERDSSVVKGMGEGQSGRAGSDDQMLDVLHGFFLKMV